MIQLISLVGALTILAAFTLQQMGKLQANDVRYLWANAVGAGTLSVIAWLEHQWGFLLMESVWTLVSLWGLLRRVRR